MEVDVAVEAVIPSGFAKVAGPVMAKAMKGAMTKDLARLTDRLQHR